MNTFIVIREIIREKNFENLVFLVFSVFVFYFTQSYPERLAKKWRLKASSQMVPAILYIVVYMRHTPNLEKAIAFAAEHLQYPLALDFKKIFYDVLKETRSGLQRFGRRTIGKDPKPLLEFKRSSFA